MFDAKRFFDDYDIPVNLTGKNTQKDWIEIKCPFHFDRSEHLGFNLKQNYFNCWYCGWFSIYDVVRKLVPGEYTEVLLKKYDNATWRYVEDECEEKEDKKDKIDMPGDFFKQAHEKYLQKRGFDSGYLEKKYSLKGTGCAGSYKFRIIAPIFYKSKLVSYQGRDITEKSKQRYKACSKPSEVMHHKDILYNFDNCNGESVVVTEGVTDVWRLGDNSCCTFGKVYSKKQLRLLSKYKRIFVFFDPDAVGKTASNELCLELDSLGKEAFRVDLSTDPADMLQNEATDFMREINVL